MRIFIFMTSIRPRLERFVVEYEARMRVPLRKRK